jgi:FlaA1/EpsC-like NDP-sugar epimerase
MNYLLNERVFKNVTSRWVIFLIEQVLAAMAVMITLLIVSRFRVWELSMTQITVILIVNAVVSAISMFAYKTHHGIIRYSEIRDLYTVMRFAVLQFFLWLGTLPVLAGDLAESPVFLIVTLLINTALITILMASFRLLVKEVYQRAVQSLTQKENVIIYGAGDIGLATKKAIEFDKKSNCRVIAFIDDSPEKVGKVLNGKRIIPSRKDVVESYLKRHKVKEIILSVEIEPSKKEAFSKICIENGIHITMIPPLSQWIKGIFNRRQLKELTIESLLGRDKIELMNEKSRQELEGKVMLVTGAAGSIGSDICRQLCRYKLGGLILLDQSETGLHDIKNELSRLNLDFELRIELATIREKQRIRQIMQKHKPHFVFHAAAYKHVPILEDYPSEVVLTNVYGTRNLADAAMENDVEKFVMISTDKAVNPANLMGACKRIGEIYVQALASGSKTQFITTRFGNVLGSNGSVVPLFKQQIAQGGPITVTHPDITRYFMTIPEASSLVLEAAVMGKGGEIFVFDMGEPVKIVDLARKMVELAGLRPDVDIPIQFSGLRPGEKMYEELFKTTENLLPTHHPKIMKANRSEVDIHFMDMTQKLVEVAKVYDERSVKALVRRIVPEFRQNKTIENTSVTYITQSIEFGIKSPALLNMETSRLNLSAENS